MNATSYMIRIGCATLLLTAAAAPVGAEETVILHADFNSDTLGEKPSTYPPGDPEGDAFGASTVGGPITVESAVADLTDQPILMKRQQIGSFGFTAYTADHPLCGLYQASWHSLMRQRPQFFYFSLLAHNPPGEIVRPVLASVIYRSAGTRRYLTYNTSVSELSVSYDLDVAQLFEVTIDMVSKTTSLSIDGVPVPEVQDRMFNQGAQWDDLSLRSLGGTPGLTDTYQLAIDDVHITCLPEPALALAQLVGLMTLGWFSRTRRWTAATAPER